MNISIVHQKSVLIHQNEIDENLWFSISNFLSFLAIFDAKINQNGEYGTLLQRFRLIENEHSESSLIKVTALFLVKLSYFWAVVFEQNEARNFEIPIEAP